MLTASALRDRSLITLHRKFKSGEINSWACRCSSKINILTSCVKKKHILWYLNI